MAEEKKFFIVAIKNFENILKNLYEENSNKKISKKTYLGLYNECVNCCDKIINKIEKGLGSIKIQYYMLESYLKKLNEIEHKEADSSMRRKDAS